MTNFIKSKIFERPKKEILNQYVSFYNEAFKGAGVKVYFDDVSFSNGMSVYVTFKKEDSELLQMRHSDHLNNVGLSVERGSFYLKTNGTLNPTMDNVNKVLEILNKYKI